MSAKRRAHFQPSLFQFLGELAKNNRREWFEAHKERFIADVRDPLSRFIADFAPRLHGLSRHFVADPRPVGGSIFRIYRDVRFAKDKSPYKTHAAAHFRHEAGRDVHAPGFYLHLEPGSVMCGAGMWHPDPKTLGQVRDALVADPARWTRAVGGKKFRALCALEGESAKRPPRGYDPEHPLIEDLKRKDFVAMVYFDQRKACSADFLDRVSDAYAATAPLVELLTEAVQLPF